MYQLYLADYVTTRTMTRKQKWTILLVASSMLAIPLILLDSPIMRLVIITLYISKYYYFLTKIPTINR
ncbi:MAG: hypothetical protein ACRC3A_04220 [Culicoidibacterales bacterium]